MSKISSRFSHLRINVPSDDLRNTAEKPKTNLFRDANTFRIQSPKNLHTLTNRPVQMIYTSPMTAKNENKHIILGNYTKEDSTNYSNSIFKNAETSYLNTMQNNYDRTELSAKTGNYSHNMLNVMKNSLKGGKNNFDNLNFLNNFNSKGNKTNSQNLNISNYNGKKNNNNTSNYNNNNNSKLNNHYELHLNNQNNNNNKNNFYNEQHQQKNTAISNLSGTSNFPNYLHATKKSNSAKKENFLNNNKDDCNESIPNQNKANTINNTKTSNKNFNIKGINLNFEKYNQIENPTNSIVYMNSENDDYNIHRDNPESARDKSNNQRNKLINIDHQNIAKKIQFNEYFNKNNLKKLKGNFNNFNNKYVNYLNSKVGETKNNLTSNIIDTKNNNNKLNANRGNNFQGKTIKTDRAFNSLSPLTKIESVFASEQKKKMQVKSNEDYNTNNLNNRDLTPNNRLNKNSHINFIGGSNNKNNSRINYEDRVVHTDTGAISSQNRIIKKTVNKDNSSITNPRINMNNNVNLNNYVNVNVNNNNDETKQNKIILSNQNPNVKNNYLINNFNNNVNNHENLNSKECEKPVVIDLMKLISSNQPPISLNVLNKKFDNFENSKCSTKRLKYIRGYSANTHQGDYWPKISIFGIYDGHGGANCADFLRDHLHQYIVRNPNFPADPRKAILEGFENAENDFLINYALDKNEEVVDRSGSCALLAIIIDDICYIANSGDSRSILSKCSGEIIEQLTNDHKPNQKNEELRILKAGGKVYQTQTPTQNINLSVLQNSFNIDVNTLSSNHVIVGPSRIFPGRLSVSRSFGDVEAKLPKFGGMSNVLIPSPDIISFKIDSQVDFLILGCDGVYDQLSNKEIVSSIWMTTQDNVKLDDIHQQCSLSNDFLIKSCLNRKCLDNITLVMIAFENFEKIFDNYYLQTHIDQPVAPVAKRLLGDHFHSSRYIREPDLEYFTEIRSDSHKIYKIPTTSKGSRSKLNKLDESVFNQDIHNNSSIDTKSPKYVLKNMTPVYNSKEKPNLLESNLKSALKNNFIKGDTKKESVDKARNLYNIGTNIFYDDNKKHINISK